MTSEELPGHLDVLFAIEAQDYNWKVAADSLRPETRLGQLVQRQDMRPWSQRRIREQDATAKPLKQMRLVGIDVQMGHLDLGTRPGHPRFTFKDICVAIFFSQRDRMISRLCYTGGENDLRAFVRQQTHAASQAENRVEYGAHYVRERAIFHYGHRRGCSVPATKKADPVSFKLDASDRFGRGRQHMHAPLRLILRRAGTTARKERAVRRMILSFDKQIAERGMRKIVGPGSQDDFGVAG